MSESARNKTPIYKQGSKFYKPFWTITVILIAAIIFLAAFFLTNYFVLEAMIVSNMENMGEISSHDAITIQNMAEYRISELEHYSHIIKSINPSDSNELMSLLNSEVILEEDEIVLALLSDDGIAYRSDMQTEINPSIRNYLLQFGDRLIMNFDKNPNYLSGAGSCIAVGKKIDLTLFGKHFDYITCAYKQNMISKNFDITTFGNEGLTSVISIDGRYIVQSNSQIFIQSNNFFKDITNIDFGKNMSQDQVTYSIINGEKIITRGDFKIAGGKESDNILVVSKIEGIDWFVVTIAPVAVFKEQGKMNAYAISIIVASILLAVWLLGVAIYRYVRRNLSLRASIASIEEAQKNHKIIEVISESYESIYEVNLATDELVIIRQEKDMAEEYSSENSFSKLMEKYIEKQVHEEDREKLLQACDFNYIRVQLTFHPRMNIGYREIYDDEIKYFEMQVDKVDGSDDTVIFSFENRTEIFKNEKAVREYAEIATALSKKYQEIYYVNVLDDNFVTFNSGDAFKIFSSEGKGRNFFNESMERVEGLVNPNDLEMVARVFNKETLLKDLEKGMVSIEYRIVLGGEDIYYRIKAVKSNDENHIIIAVEDINDEMRERIIQQEKLEQALELAKSSSKAKSVFLNNMSHDIRTPMNAIIGFTNLAEKSIDDQEKMKDYLFKISNASNHLLSLINDVLDMSRIESGKVIIDNARDNLDEIIEKLNEMVVVEIEKKKQLFSIDITKVKHKNIICDRLRLNQVIINLLSNSIKYTPEDGEISLIIKEDYISDNKSSYTFIVKDNGIGMSDEYQKTIFEPFTREKSSTVSGIQGTGLGMAITKNIVDMMHGNIFVSSKLNYGTEFKVVIDFETYENEKVREEVKETQDDSKFDGLKVLLVEDNELNREIALAILEEKGMNVSCAEDGSIAVKMMEENPAHTYDIILMDIQMPIMNGYEATKAIRQLEDKEKANIPIIAMTANAFQEDKQNAMEAGMNDHVAKPIEVDILFDSLRKILK